MRFDRDRLRSPHGDVEIGWVAELDPRLTSSDEPRRGRDWWAVKGEGAFRDGEALAAASAGPLEVLGLETARPELRGRLRIRNRVRGRSPHPRARLGGDDPLPGGRGPARRDGLACARSARSTRRPPSCSVTEAGGAVLFPAADELSLEMRSPVLAARDQALLERLRPPSCNRRALEGVTRLDRPGLRGGVLPPIWRAKSTNPTGDAALQCRCSPRLPSGRSGHLVLSMARLEESRLLRPRHSPPQARQGLRVPGRR